MSKVRAKFQCWSIVPGHTGNPNDVCAEVRFTAAYGEDNKEWSKATPSGEVRMFITNPAAIDAFEIGRQYFLEITPA